MLAKWEAISALIESLLEGVIVILGSALSRAKRPGFTRSVGILTSGTMLANALGILTTPVVSRLYDPEDFGEYAVVLSVSAIVSAVISLGLQSAIVKAESDEDGVRILGVAVMSAGVIAIALAAIGIGIGFVLNVSTSSLPYSVICVLVAVLAFLTSASGSLRALANRRSANRVLFSNYLVGACATLVITVPLGLLGSGSIGLISGSLGAMIICNGQMVLRLRPFAGWFSRADINEVYHKNRDFIRFQYPASLAESVSSQAPRQVLSIFSGSAAVGLYAMTDKLLGIPLRLIGAPVGTVFFREAAQRHSRGEDLTRFTSKLVFRIMALAYGPILVLVLWGEPLFSWALGSKWGPAGTLASVMIIQYVFMLTRISVGTLFVVLNRQSLNLLMGVVRLIVEVGALALGALITRDVFGTLVCFSIASSSFYMFEMTVIFRVMGGSHWRYLGGVLAYSGSIAALWLLLGMY